MLEKEIRDLEKVLRPLLIKMYENKIGVAKWAIDNEATGDILALMVVAIGDKPKIASLSEFVDLSMQDRTLHSARNIDLDWNTRKGDQPE